jgi:hypothetical protein
MASHHSMCGAAVKLEMRESYLEAGAAIVSQRVALAQLRVDKSDRFHLYAF